MPTSQDAGSEGHLGALRTTLVRVARPGWPAAVAAVLGLGLQIVAFLSAFGAASPGRTQLTAVAGLLVSLALLTQMAVFVDHGWLEAAPAMASLVFGAFVGGVLAFFLTSEVLGSAGELFLYTATVLVAGTFVCGLLLMAAGIGYTRGHAAWRPLLASPLLLHVGAHAVLFAGLLVPEGMLVAAAGLPPFLGP